MRPATIGKTRDSVLSRLKEEVALQRDFTGLNEAAFLSLVWTWQRLERAGRQFFAQHAVTDVQFNVLMVLWDHRGRSLRQHELADLLVVNRASAGAVLDRMERNGWITRRSDPADRRAICVKINSNGIAKLNEVRPGYYELLAQLFRKDDEPQQRQLLEYFDTLRARLDAIGAAGHKDDNDG
jgi:DNA-binding MarR family transcriptional regulator